MVTHQPYDLGVWPAPPCMSIFTGGGMYQEDIPGPAAKGTWDWNGICNCCPWPAQYPYGSENG